MANIYEELKHVVSSDLVGKLTGKLGGNASHIQNATNKLLPTMLAKFMTKSDSPAVHDLLHDAGKLNLPGVEHLMEGTAKKPSLGERFVSSVMGNQESALHTMAEKEGLSASHAKSLTAGIGAVMTGFLGKRMLQHGGAEHMMNELKSERNSILASVPAELKSKLHLSPESMHCEAPRRTTATHHDTHHTTHATHGTAHAAHAAHDTKSTTHGSPAPKKKSLAWLWWLLGLIVLALLLCALFRKGGCHRKAVVAPAVVEQVVTTPVKAVTQTVESYDLALPDGSKLSVKQGTLIDRLVVFLRSDKYKNGDDNYMKRHWFEFEDIDFQYNSTTEFVEGSDENVKNIASVLKAFPDARVRIGGNADHKGKEKVNMAISKARAATIKQHLVADGVAPERISTEGFGEEMAILPATATDTERAPDRDFAMRFVK